MLGVVRRYVPNRMEAEDLLQDGFVTIFTHIGDFRNEGSFEGWCRRIFVNAAIARVRRSGRLFDDSFDEGYMLPVDPHAFDSLSTADIMSAIGKLPAGYRTVLNLYAIDGYSHEEVAERLGISSATSRTQLLRARARLSEILSKDYDYIHNRNRDDNNG